MNTFKPDHNGECTHCDEPGDAHLCPSEDEARLTEQEISDALAIRRLDARDRDFIKRLLKRIGE